MARLARVFPWSQHWAIAAAGGLFFLVAAGQAARPDAALDRIFFDRQAYEIGEEFALTAVVRTQLGQAPRRNAEMERVARSLWRRIQKRGQWLGVQEELDDSWVESPPSADKPAMLLSSIRAFDPALVGLQARLGARPQAVAKLAFDLRLAPDTFERLSGREKTQAVIGLRRTAAQASLDASLLEPLQRSLLNGSPRPVLYDQIDEIHHLVISRFDSSAAANDAVRRLRANVFDAGVYVSVAVLAAAQRLDVKLGTGQGSIESLFDQARDYVRNATLTAGGIVTKGMNFPQPPPLSSNESDDLVHAVRFLLDIIGHDTAAQLNDLLGRPLVAVFEAAVRSQIAVVLYSEKEDSLERSIREALQRAATDALLPPRLWQDMIDAMKRGLSLQQVKTAIRNFQKRTREYLRGT